MAVRHCVDECRDPSVAHRAGTQTGPRGNSQGAAVQGRWRFSLPIARLVSRCVCVSVLFPPAWRCGARVCYCFSRYRTDAVFGAVAVAVAVRYSALCCAVHTSRRIGRAGSYRRVRALAARCNRNSGGCARKPAALCALHCATCTHTDICRRGRATRVDVSDLGLAAVYRRVRCVALSVALSGPAECAETPAHPQWKRRSRDSAVLPPSAGQPRVARCVQVWWCPGLEMGACFRGCSGAVVPCHRVRGSPKQRFFGCSLCRGLRWPTPWWRLLCAWAGV